MARANLVTFTAFRNEAEAIALLERLRWPNGAACPHCGGADPYRLKAGKSESGKRGARCGLWKCSQCRKQFTVKVGTVFEQSHIPVSKWLMAIHLIACSKKGMSAHQFHRMLGLTYRAAWFMAHRLRYAMSSNTGVFTKLTGIVEADETYVGGRRRKNAPSAKVPVVALVQRKGHVVAWPMERVTADTVGRAIEQHVAHTATLMTDESSVYKSFTEAAGMKHETVNHSQDEYVRGNTHSNTVEGFFSLLKRGLNGTFHHVSKGHLHRYCDEFAFRYNTRTAMGVNDTERAEQIVLGAEGKRLTFKQPSGTRAA
ncbi:MAG: IS1595 family transposase [Vicinamibacterales bacterium]